MNIKIELKNEKFCEWCPFLIAKAGERIIKKRWLFDDKIEKYVIMDFCSFYNKSTNNEGKGAIRFNECIKENR